jgi:putative RecB family exonuclease
LTNIIKILKKRPEEKIFGLSVSKVKTFKTCKKQFKFSYIERLPQKEWPFTKFGKFLHEILEKFQKARLAGNLEPDNILISFCFKSSLENWKDKLPKEHITEAKEIISNYLKILDNNRLNNIKEKIIGVEDEFFISINDKYLLNGIIDLIKIDNDNVLHIVDYKSSDLKDEKHPELDFTETKKFERYKKDLLQLKLYAYVACLRDPNLEIVRCSYVMLRHNFYHITKEFKKTDIMKMEEYIILHAEKILNERIFRPSPMILCNWCSYIDNCVEGRNFINKPDGKTFGEIEW